MREAPDEVDVAAERRRGLVVGARVRACVAVGAFAAGLLVARQWGAGPSPLWFGVAGVGMVVAFLTRGGPARAALVASALTLGVGWYTLRVREVPPSSLIRLVVGDAAALGVPVVFEGTVLDEPRTVTAHPAGVGGGTTKLRTTRLEMAVEALRSDAGERPAAGVVRLVVFDAVVGVRAGDRVRVRGLFLPVSGPQNPGESDQRDIAAMEGRVGTLEVDSGELIEAVADVPAVGAQGLARRVEHLWLRGLASLRATANAWLAPALDAEAGGGPVERLEARALLGALLLGQEDAALAPINERFARLGVVHVLSISGFHLVVMTGAVLACVRLTGDRGAWEPLIAGAFVVLYMLVVPAGAPILRSGVMVLALLAAEVAGRRYDRLTVLLWAAFIVLVWRPLDLWSAGAQLSFGITGALIGLGSRFHARLFGVPLRGLVSRRSVAALVARGAWRWLQAGISTSLLCWAVSVPVVLYHMGLVSPLAALSSVLLVPLFSLLLMAGFAAMALGALSAGAAAVAGRVLVWLAEVANTGSSWLDGLPGMALYLPAVPVAWTICATAMLVWWCGWARVRGGRAWWGAAATLVWLACELALPLRGVGPGVRLDVLAIGDGAAVLVRSGPDAVLWGGSSRQVPLARRVVPRAVRALGVWPVERVVIPAATPAEVLALPGLVRPLGVREVLVCADLYEMWRQQPAQPQSQAIAAAAAQGVKISRLDPGARLAVGWATLACTAADERGGTLGGVLSADDKPRVVLANTDRAVAVAGESALAQPAPLLVLGPGVRSGTEAARLGAERGAPLVWWCAAARAAGARGELHEEAGGVRLHVTGLRGAATARFSQDGVLSGEPTASWSRSGVVGPDRGARR